VRRTCKECGPDNTEEKRLRKLRKIFEIELRARVEVYRGISWGCSVIYVMLYIFGEVRQCMATFKKN